MITFDSHAWGVTQLLSFFGPRLLFAILCGGIVGLERELKGKPAGIKTNILICVGSMIFTTVGVLMAEAFSSKGHYGDPGRLAAQIVSGIGFLGGGVIMREKGSVLGLTTAATIWVVAAMGVCIGIGHPEIALGASLSVVAILVATSSFEDRMLGRSLAFRCEVVLIDPEGTVRAAIHQALARNDLVLDDFDLERQSGRELVSMSYRGHRTAHRKFVLELWATPGVHEVRQL